MRSAWLTAVVVLIGATAVVQAEVLPVDDPLIRASFAELVRQGGYGSWATEEAAFVIRGDDGGYRLVVWRSEREVLRRTYRGAIPRGAVAIVHTHPRERPYGSPADQQTARRLAMPVFVLTPLNIVVVTPDGRNVALVRNETWVLSAAGSIASRADARRR